MTDLHKHEPPEPVVGAYGLRTFRIAPDGSLLPLTGFGGSKSWRTGSCVATCRLNAVSMNPVSFISGIAAGIALAAQRAKDPEVRRIEHEAPGEYCTCGVYTFKTLTVLRAQYPLSYLIVAVIALEGDTVEGSKGYRSAAGRVVGAWTDSRVPRLVRWRRRTRKFWMRYPDVRRFATPEELVGAYPGLELGPESVRAEQEQLRCVAVRKQLLSWMWGNIAYLYVGYVALHWVLEKLVT